MTPKHIKLSSKLGGIAFTAMPLGGLPTAGKAILVLRSASYESRIFDLVDRAEKTQ
jgi:hypothetical protein